MTKENLNKLMSLTSKYESNDDPSMVSSGIGDVGGISYGCYQFASNIGTVNKFIDWLCQYQNKSLANYGTVLKQNYPINNNNFINTWQYLGTVDPGNFKMLQDEFVLNQYYYPLFQRFQAKYFNIDKHSLAMKAVIISRSIQNGPTGCINLTELACTEMLEYQNLSYVDDKYFDDQLIEAIYDFLIEECDNVYYDSYYGYYQSPYKFCHGSRSVIYGLKNRFIHEKQDALNLLIEKE